MNESNDSKFNITIDGESPDSHFQEDAEELQTVKLNKRITRNSILIILLMGAVILFAYMDLKKRLFTVNSSGNTEIQTLSKGMRSKFSSLSLQQAKFAEALSAKIEPLEKTVASIQKNLKEIATTMEHIRLTEKETHKKTAETIESIQQTLAPISRKLENLTSDMDQLNQKYSKELASLSRMFAIIRLDMQQLQSGFDVLSASQADKIDKKSIGIALSHERNIFQDKLSQLKKDFENRLLAMEEKIKELERQQSSAHNGPIRSQQQAPISAGENTSSRPGPIIEQDIKR